MFLSANVTEWQVTDRIYDVGKIHGNVTIFHSRCGMFVNKVRRSRSEGLLRFRVEVPCRCFVV